MFRMTQKPLESGVFFQKSSKFLKERLICHIIVNHCSKRSVMTANVLIPSTDTIIHMRIYHFHITEVIN